ncbi:hypothetical protein [Nostocoides sp. Soil756]|uniref:hypothetical protein n=1 Tax=Nostocoides sp. Soil756 TaxID=1736399 RepID=UPI0007004015|nr:hypothetical protein [Tetrasphaera sp. Soil756]KRE62278.1 hypothetical protein ASG78_04310 [Tetrasphaera sp. Soil756]
MRLTLGVFLALQLVAAFSFARLDDAWPHGRLNWDGDHFLTLATSGYPAASAGMPVADLQRFAFYPLYPLLVRLVSGGERDGALLVAPLLSLALAAVALLLAGNWMSERFGPAGPVALLVGLAAWPTFPVLQMGYTEGLAMFLLVVALRALDERHHTVFAVAVLMVGLTRPLAAPLAVVALVHLVARYREGGGRHHLAGPLGAFAAAVGAVLLWPALAALISGRPLVYAEAMASFRAPGHAASYLVAGLQTPWLGALLLGGLAVGVWLALRFLPTGTPATLRVWLLVYPAYLVGVSVVSTSPLRYLLLAFPFALALVPLLRRPAARGAVLVAVVPVSVVLSGWWVQTFVPVTSAFLP